MDPTRTWIEDLLNAAPARPPLPRRLAATLSPRATEGWDADTREALVDAIEAALREFPPHPEDRGGLDLRGLVRYAETNLASASRHEAALAANPLVRDRDAVLAQARASCPTWSWTDRDGPWRAATIRLGRLSFRVSFIPTGEPGVWHQAWGPVGATDGLVDHLDALARRGERVRTGIFPAIDACIGAITRDFIVRTAPSEVVVKGRDALRNTHNLATYGRHAPDGYALEPVRFHPPDQAEPGNVIGVRFVRAPSSTPSPAP
jgi:hypothetical protein